jgi:hypothetical protein
MEVNRQNGMRNLIDESLAESLGVDSWSLITDQTPTERRNDAPGQTADHSNLAKCDIK